MKLTEKSVLVIYGICLVDEDIESREGIEAIDGVYLRTIYLSPTRLRIHEKEIVELLDQLSDSFLEPAGQFLMDGRKRKEGGENWTNHDIIVDMLFILGQGLKHFEHRNGPPLPLRASGTALIVRVPIEKE